MKQAIIVTDNVEEIRETTKKRNRRKHFILGTIVFVLAMIGLVTISYIMVQTSKSIIYNTAQKEKWEEYIETLVMDDTIPFEGGETLDETRVRRISLWAALINNPPGSFARDETGAYVVPQEEVEKQARDLFGPNIVVNHLAVSEPIELEFYYDLEKNSYFYESDSDAINSFQAKVVEIKKRGNEIRLTVTYERAKNVWELNEEADPEFAVPQKQYYYIIKQEGNLRYIAAIRELRAGADPLTAGFSDSLGNETSIQSEEIGAGGEGAGAEDGVIITDEATNSEENPPEDPAAAEAGDAQTEPSEEESAEV